MRSGRLSQLEKTMRIKRRLPLSLALAIAATAAVISPAATAQQPSNQRCFWVRNVNSFRSIDNRTVYLRTSSRDVFELTLFAPCLGVDWAHNIALRPRGSSNICEGRMTGLEIQARTSAGGRQRCSVTSVRWLSPDETASLPSRARP
jgi:hypothetical protein